MAGTATSGARVPVGRASNGRALQGVHAPHQARRNAGVGQCTKASRGAVAGGIAHQRHRPWLDRGMRASGVVPGPPSSAGSDLGGKDLSSTCGILEPSPDPFGERISRVGATLVPAGSVHQSRQAPLGLAGPPPYQRETDRGRFSEEHGIHRGDPRHRGPRRHRDLVHNGPAERRDPDRDRSPDARTYGRHNDPCVPNLRP